MKHDPPLSTVLTSPLDRGDRDVTGNRVFLASLVKGRWLSERVGRVRNKIKSGVRNF